MFIHMFLHIDINSYFASILQQENPFLRGKPVGVVKSVGRTCIIAASKEAKKYGVKTGCNVKDAKILIPSIILIPAEFDLYLHCTKKLKTLFEEITPDVEIFSLDEAFIPLENCRYLYPDPYKLAIHMQKRVKEELGEWVTCNIGIAKNRLLAKIASEIGPKGSIIEITDSSQTRPVWSPNPVIARNRKRSVVGRSNLGIDHHVPPSVTRDDITHLRIEKDEVLKTVEFKDVCGIGIRLEERLAALGVKHPHDINFLTDEDLEKHFGPFLGKELRKIGRGEGSYILDRVDESDHMKSVGRTITGYKLEGREEVIKRVLYNLMEEVTYKVRKMDLSARQAGIFLQGEDKSWHSHKTLKHYIRHTNEMFDLTYNQGYKKWKRNFSVIRYGVWLTLLKPISETQPTLFPDWYRKERLYKAMDIISEKFGLFTLHSGI